MSRVLVHCVVLISVSGCNMIKGPPRDHECRATLRSIVGLENAFFAQHQRYAEHPVEIGFAPAQGNRYLYLFAPEGPLTRRDEVASAPLSESVGYGPDSKKRMVLLEDLLALLPADVRASTGLHGACPSCDVTIACVGNLDDDPQVDVWSISTADRPAAPRGTPIHHLKDLDP